VDYQPVRGASPIFAGDVHTTEVRVHPELRVALISNASETRKAVEQAAGLPRHHACSDGVSLTDRPGSATMSKLPDAVDDQNIGARTHLLARLKAP